MCINLLGPEVGMTPTYAVVNAIKGRSMPLDLCSVTQGSSQTFSFLTQAFGLMADLDLGTEHLRFVSSLSSCNMKLTAILQMDGRYALQYVAIAEFPN